MSTPAISVVIPTYNRAALLKLCIDSILAQTLPASQILVVDDGSTDSTPALLGGMAPRIQSVRVPQGGKSRALNEALTHVTGDYLWVFDDDDIAVPDALERFAAPLQRDPSLGFSYSHYWYTPGLDDGELAAPMGTSRIPETSRRGVFVPLLEFNFLSGAALFARSGCYSSVGGYDPTLTRSQEYDMAIRIARRFRGVQVAGGPTFHLRLHSGFRGSQSDRFQAGEKKRKWLEYDQKIFRRLRQELSLHEYLGPGLDVMARRRTALLQRAVIMSGKSLFAEALEDLTEIAADPNQSPLDDYEIPLVRDGLGGRPFYGGGLRWHAPTLAAVRELSRRSPVIREVSAILRNVIVGEMKGVAPAMLRKAGRGRLMEARIELGRAGRLAVQLARVSPIVP